jgi:Flp pilus assembly protein TadD
VEMGDLPGAGRCLEGLLQGQGQEGGGGGAGEWDGLVRARVGLIYLMVGNLARAKEFVGQAGVYAGALEPLVKMSEGDFAGAAEELREKGRREDPLAMNNLAVCLLYSGKIVEARTLLEGLIKEGYSFKTLLFNLSTIFELCTDRQRVLKNELAEQVAKMGGSIKGWERTNADFKL